jgi:hypothetical protein
MQTDLWLGALKRWMKIKATLFTRTWRTIGKCREIDFRDEMAKTFS